MLLNCAWHAAVVFFIPFWLFKGAIWSPDGHTDGLYMFGTTVNACCMITVNLKCGFMTRSFTKWNALALFYSVVVWFCFVIVYAEMDFISPRFFGLGEELYGNVAFWLSLPLVPFLACMPDMVVQYIQVRLSVSLAAIHIHSLQCRCITPIRGGGQTDSSGTGRSSQTIRTLWCQFS
jgi:hypothetical protein